MSLYVRDEKGELKTVYCVILSVWCLNMMFFVVVELMLCDHECVFGCCLVLELYVIMSVFSPILLAVVYYGMRADVRDYECV